MNQQSGLSIALLSESDGPAGAEKMLLHLAEALRERGYAVCPVVPGNGCGWLPAEFRRRAFTPELFVMRRPVDWRCLLGLVNMLRRRGVELVHSHDFTMAVYGAAAAGILRRPHVITMHGGRYFAGRWSRRVALRAAAGRAAAAVAVSAALQADLATVLRLPRAAIPARRTARHHVMADPVTGGQGCRTCARLLAPDCGSDREQPTAEDDHR